MTSTDVDTGTETRADTGEVHDEAGDQCSVCMAADADAVFLPCGHGGVCWACARQWVHGTSEEARQDAPEALQAALSLVDTPLLLVRHSRTYFVKAAGL